MDINKRTILWIVFAVSLVSPVEQLDGLDRQPIHVCAAAGARPPKRRKRRRLTRRRPQYRQPARLPGAAAPPRNRSRVSASPSPPIVFRVDIDTLGGTIKRLELLKYKDGVDPTKNQVLFDVDAATGKTYLAEDRP
jgi:YidC/Oxa1 family membrane protein insertase